jgi:hypothetical protein
MLESMRGSNDMPCFPDAASALWQIGHSGRFDVKPTRVMALGFGCRSSDGYLDGCPVRGTDCPPNRARGKVMGDSMSSAAPTDALINGKAVVKDARQTSERKD